MSVKTTTLISVWALLTVGLFGAALAMLALYTPNESTMGQIQKIFYIHLPVAINTFLACFVCFVASVGYLCQRKAFWDDLAASAAKVAVVLCTIVLVTGMFWAKGAWGQWWTWSPRLTFSLMLWLLYVVYLIIRNSVDYSQRRAVIGAAYAVIAFLDVPLVYLSSRLMDDIHPQSVSLDPKMKLTLMLWFLPVTLAVAGMIALRYKLARQQALAGEKAAASAEAQPKAAQIVPGSPAWNSLLTGRSSSTATVEANK